jgi:hypothetical protein
MDLTLRIHECALVSLTIARNCVNEDEMGRACSTMGGKRNAYRVLVGKPQGKNAYRVLVGKPQGKRPLGRPRRRWVDNIKMNPREIGWDGMDWIVLAYDGDQWRAFVNKVMNLRIP